MILLILRGRFFLRKRSECVLVANEFSFCERCYARNILQRTVLLRKGFTEKGRLLAAGAIAGEGFIGMVLLLIGLAQTFF